MLHFGGDGGDSNSRTLFRRLPHFEGNSAQNIFSKPYKTQHFSARSVLLAGKISFSITKVFFAL